MPKFNAGVVVALVTVALMWSLPEQFDPVTIRSHVRTGALRVTNTANRIAHDLKDWVVSGVGVRTAIPSEVGETQPPRQTRLPRPAVPRPPGPLPLVEEDKTEAVSEVTALEAPEVEDSLAPSDGDLLQVEAEAEFDLDDSLPLPSSAEPDDAPEQL